MKYTVVIRQAVPDEVRPQLEQQLVERFNLSREQAGRLAARKTGRLMKPTGRGRAELLLSVFESVGAAVSLEEVREETGLLNEPFQGISAGSATGTHTTGFMDEAPLASLMTPGDPMSEGEGLAWLSRTGETALPATAAWQNPGATDWSGDAPARGEGNGPNSAASSGDPMGLFGSPAATTRLGRPSLARPEAMENSAPLLADPLPGLSTLGQASETLVITPDTGAAATGVSPTDPVPAAPANEDVWSDFTGALTVNENKAAAPTEEASQSVLLSPVAHDAPSTLRRRTLLQQLTFSTLTPLLLSSGLTIGLLSFILPQASQSLVQQNAQAVAVAVGTSLDVSNQAAVENQLNSLLGHSSVGFIHVELPDGTGHFRSRNPTADSTLQTMLSTQTSKNPKLNTIRFNVSLADAFREQLQQLEDIGAGQSAQAEQLRSKIKDPANQTVDRETYILSRLNVALDQAGRRVTSEGNTNQNDLLYRVTVGVSNEPARRNLISTLLAVLAASLLALGLGALLARRAAQRVAQPIEHLVKVADAISMGDLSQPVKAERNDEIGDLAQALERMRQSLEAAMERLRRRKRG